MSLPIRALLRARRVAVDRGELRWMWPGGVWDAVTLVWWRGVWFPVTNRFRKPHPDAVFHSFTGGCPLCNPADTTVRSCDADRH